MNDEWLSGPLSVFASVSRNRIDPRDIEGNRELIHYSIPALDETDQPAIELASTIGSHKFQVEQDSVLVSLLNPRIPRVWLAKGSPSALCSTEFAVLSPASMSVDIRFLYLLCQSPSFWDELQKRAVGSTGSRQRAKVDGLLSIEVQMPPLPVQRRIVDLMAHLDNHLANLRAEREAANLLLAVHRDRIMRVGRPTRAGSVFEILIGRQRSPKRATGPSMTPYLRAANIKDGHLDLSDVKEMDFDAAERRKFGLINGDVLVSEGSGSADAVGASARWANEVSGPVCFQNTLLRYRAIEDVSIPSFVYHWCRWAHESGAFKETATGTNILHIGSTRAVEMLVHVPSISNQIEACDLLDSLETSTTSLEREIKDAVHLRGQLLARVLTGSTAVLPSYDAHISEVA